MAPPLLIIDPGHGGKDPGAVGPNGLTEAAVALDVACRLALLLSPYDVHTSLTRNTDVFVELDRRAALANDLRADLFLSIHLNACESHNARGYEVWTTKGQTAADPFAGRLFITLALAFPDLPGRKDMSDGDTDKESNFAVLRLTNCPAALVELDFLDHPDAAAAWEDPQTRDRAAAALAGAVLAQVGQRSNATPLFAEAPASLEDDTVTPSLQVPRDHQIAVAMYDLREAFERLASLLE